jgi:hypothetical protein
VTTVLVEIKREEDLQNPLHVVFATERGSDSLQISGRHQQMQKRP